MSHRLIAHIFRIFLFAALIAMASASRLHAQNSQVSGQILDPSGAAISNASVTLTRAESGDRRIVASGPEGYYAFPLLLPGHYELKVEKDGFQAYVQTGIVVETGAISTINVALEVGAVTEDITVNANPPQLQTESGPCRQWWRTRALRIFP